MDEIEQRLRDASEKCIASYMGWRDKKDGDEGVQEALQEAVHELRKVASRLEIEIAVSERDAMSQRPIPIPPHRSSRPRNHNHDDLVDDEGSQSQRAGGGMQRKPMRRGRRPMPHLGQGSDPNPGNGPESSEG